MSNKNPTTISMNYAQIATFTGLASRRDLRKRRVKLTAVDGSQLQPRDRVDVGRDEQRFVVAGREVAFWAEHDAVWAMHKPSDFVVSRSFDDGESIFSILPFDAPLEHLEPIGRLDADTRGLLLFTEDGQLNQRMRNPSREVPRTYLVGLADEVDESLLATALAGELSLRDGDIPNVSEIVTEKNWEGAGYGWLKTLCPEFLHPLPTVRYLVTLTEGRYHEVRRIFAALGSHVESLQRVRFGPYWLLPRGTDPDAAARALIALEELNESDTQPGTDESSPRPVIVVFLDEGESTQLPEDEVQQVYDWFNMERTSLRLRIRFPGAE